jgi:predicted RNA methylase
MFTIPEADYSFLFHQEPSFSHNHFAMVADAPRLQAYADALSKAVRRAAATQHQQQQQQQQQHEQQQYHPLAGGIGISEVIPSVSANSEQWLTVVDLGCGSGVLSMLAAAVLRAESKSAGSERGGPAAAPVAAAAAVSPAAVSAESAAEGSAAPAVPGPMGCSAADTYASAPEATHPSAAKALPGSVVGIELVAPLAAVAQRAAAANGMAGVVSVVQADAGSCKRGQQVPLRGADVIMLNMFDAGELVDAGI